MARTLKTIHVTDDTALADLLDDAAREPIILERNGDRFRLSLLDDLFADYDPERVRDRLRRFAGTITPEEADRLRQIVYRGREEDTRSIDRP